MSVNKRVVDRVIHFDGAENVRDLGGLPTSSGAKTRFGVIYRGSGLARLTDADVENFSGLGVRSIIDLRSDEEREGAPDRLPSRRPPEVFRRRITPQGSIEMMDAVNKKGAGAAAAFELMRSNYARIPFGHSAEFTDIMHFLIEHGRAPHFVHCSYGKDRTGIVVAFILRALGVSVTDVVIDFEMTKAEFIAPDLFDPAARADAIAAIMAAPADYILASLEAIDSRHGDFSAYLKDVLNFGPTEQKALATMLLE
jgi:protein-tyrosine phosphatase